MSFAQLTYRESLRDIEACLRSRGPKLYPMGFRGNVARSTLAYFSTGGGGLGGGFRGLRGQRLHPETKQPIGEPKDIYPLFSGRYKPAASHGDLAMSPARDRVLFSMIEMTGNIWLAEPRKEDE
jgi:hypothetical protein